MGLGLARQVISTDPNYAPGPNRDLYFHTEITGSITHQILVDPVFYSFYATSYVRFLMNGYGPSIFVDTAGKVIGRMYAHLP